ncbi:unnamed protein product [Durusdinium trenchii]|uniref:Sodium channel protein type 10 subunit alpha n=2 Tax=Durusdinium trenchii TaxID=1381693 RepID=A0ABP0LXD1_9DINO
MLCFAVGQPISLLATVGYWILVWPEVQSGEQEVTYLSVYNHGINGLLLLVNFMISRMPYTSSNGGWVILAGLLYLAFTYVHFLLHLGMVKDCDGYEDKRDRPIYSQFDWHKPEKTGLLTLLAVGILLLVILLYMGLASLTDRCARCGASLAAGGMTGEGEVKELLDVEDLLNEPKVTEPLKGPKPWPLQVPRGV